MGLCAFVSFRLGLGDGVSAVARLWERSLHELGWETITVAGGGPVDRLVPDLGIGAGVEITTGPDPDKLRADLTSALADADLVVAENILSIPLNLSASRALADVLRGRPALLHHHDPPWQRERFAHITELPPDDGAWRHVTINRLTEREFNERGLTATTIYNGFDTEIHLGDRSGTRAALGLTEDDLLFVHPVRAIARKNVPEAIRLAEKFGATYWLPGPAEEGYEGTLEVLLADASCPVVRRPLSDERSVANLYAASDMVMFPSTWEGFGNPPIEAAIHGRPVVVGRYPVADELRQLGFRWLDPDDAASISKALDEHRAIQNGEKTAARSDDVAHNRAVVYRHLTLATTTESIRRLLEQAGWHR